MNFSGPFIARPIATTLLAIGLFLVGLVAYDNLPVASLPAVDLPTIRVSASRPGADPAIMAATVAAPLERRIGEIPGVTELTSTSSLGSTSIVAQFDLSRNVDGAARDVQAAINAALSDLPGDLPARPTFRKMNPAAAPALILALTSKTMRPSAVYDVADTVIAQRIAQVDGVAEVSVSGAEQPAIRVRVDPGAIAAMGLALEDVRKAIVDANATGPLGTFDGDRLGETIGTNGQLRAVRDYENIVVRARDGAVVRLGAIATVDESTRNSRSAAWFNRDPSVLLIITKQADANVITMVDRIRALIPELQRWIPADLEISVLTDRTETIRASVQHMKFTLAATIVLVMLVVYVFLRQGAATVAAGITVPLSLAGTCAVMWALGYSINNLSLMALIVSVGFVVDDAIVMIENAFRNLEKGLTPLQAAREGARQIGFTVISISLSLIAAFIPILFMGGIVGRFLREFSMTLAAAIVVSTVVSLSVTPMICAHFVKRAPGHSGRFDRIVDGVLGALVRAYAKSLDVVLRHRFMAVLSLLLTIGLTVYLYVVTPKGFIPQDDTNLIFGGVVAATDVSYQEMLQLQQRATEIVLSDPAVSGVGSSVGGSGWSGSVNNGRLFISLKPLAERGVTAQRVVDRLRGKLMGIPGVRVFMFPASDVRVGGRSSRSQYQFTLWSPNFDELQAWVPKVQERIGKVPGVIDVSTDREQGGLQADVVIDRVAAARLGVDVQEISDALNNAFSQRQVSTIFTQRNQYRVVLEIDPRWQRDPSDLDRVYVQASKGTQVPLSAVARFERGLAPLVINHQGPFPAVTITYNLTGDMPLATATAEIRKAVDEMHLPDSIRTDFAGDAKNFAQSAGAQPLLLLAALLAVYIVLGVLYESLAHPLTIISTLPSAGLGALLALNMFKAELTVIAFIGIILLIGIVKKNGIMLVDFALEAERSRGLTPAQAVHEACVVRFRPILMTTFAALLGALPLVLATGPGSELRRPLGITIMGGLVVSQVLTLYTTPVIYLLLDRLHRRWWGKGQAGRDGGRAAGPGDAARPVPAE
ncbi:acriflavine resistance protein B [Rhodoplanes elegans]|uniref:Acriflavine resistance protein B n=1 Tax=Rhodoplanes elegans TaxID=29408 RepID=A0A327KVW0_9BRAD|nr:efflux RND transporter permease subunit [Rhodoplanes elegans]MBK5960154.1 acriflavine resistance protein B [Rhodoplanes elegans]RAI41342.1 acriflavine resistance protein B [Rhodoplanes elegans]